MRQAVVVNMLLAGFGVAALGVLDRAAAAPADSVEAHLAALEKEIAVLRRENRDLRQHAALTNEPVTQRPDAGRRSSSTALQKPATPIYASAAPVYKAPPATTAYGWSGPYLGGNFGLSVARDPSQQLFLTTTGNVFSNDRFTMSPAGAAGGVQIGYNWQFKSDLVAGLEADFQWSGLHDSTICLADCRTIVETFSQSMPWFGTVRGRLGWTDGPTLYYATAGWAYANVKTNFNETDNSGNSAAARINSHISGLAVGAGVESQIVGNWTGKVEYLYMDLGSVSGMATTAGGDPGESGEPITFSSRVHDHVVRFGTNYKFGDPIYSPAIEAASDSAASFGGIGWSGAYFGGNLGLSIAKNPATDRFVESAGNLQFADQFNLSPTGALAGGQIGYNFQPAPNWVWGLEADLQQGSGISDSTTCIDSCDAISKVTVAQRLPWLATARGRLGWTNGPTLFYATGGLAYGRVDTDVNFSLFSTVLLLTTTGSASGSFSEDKLGWTAGGGIESQLGGRWTGKLEYLYVDLGSVSEAALVMGTSPLGGATFTVSNKVSDHILRAGVNYKLYSDEVAARN
jgi:outer membrane immunogenic protein